MTGTEPSPAGPSPLAAIVADGGRDPASAAGQPARWEVAMLCGEAGEAILVHKGEHYRLRVTARGRLILTK